MQQFSTEELKCLALAAVDEAAEEAWHRQVKPTQALWFALAFLANFTDDYTPFDDLWRFADCRDYDDRYPNVNKARHAIHQAVRIGRSDEHLPSA